VAHFGYPPVPDDMADILFGPVFEELSVNPLEGAELLRKPMTSSGPFIKLVKEILTLNEEKVRRVRQLMQLLRSQAWLDVFKDSWYDKR